MSLLLSSRFSVTFFAGGVVPNPLDIRFQRVSGLSSSVETSTVNEGGQNLYTHRLPKRVSYGNLVLERGFVLGSPLNAEFEAAMSFFRFAPSNVLVTLFSEAPEDVKVAAIPVAAWLFLKAFPQRWATADLGAAEDRVLIDTLELAYTSMQVMKVG
ncbi:MAG TPA: phage tail protein [Polyangiaceae bacterium]|nr:phage tail protein [Polyangiaceae bacterium]